MRQLGLRGSGQTFTLPSDRYWAQVGFQKSTSSSAATVKFTVNLQVMTRDAWAEAREAHPWMGERPSPNSGYPVKDSWWKRIGSVLPGGNDHWWTVDPDHPTEPVGNEVVTAIRDFGLAAMNEQMH